MIVNMSEKATEDQINHVIERIREIKAGRQGALTVLSPDVKVTGIEADLADELTHK